MSVTNVEYSCSVCAWVYRPAEHGNIEFADVPHDWICPNCQAEQDQFTVLVPNDLETDDTENAINSSSLANEIDIRDETSPEQRVL